MSVSPEVVHPAVTREADREALRTVSILAAAIVLARSAVFAFAPQAFFDADQGVMGLMAKHLSEGRAFPLFLYGQNYILAVEAWMAAPLFALAGPSVALLKLPLVAINLATGVLLVRLLVRDAGLRPWPALVASMFFLVPPPGTAAQLVEASGGNLEPFLYVLLLWVLRRRGWIFGGLLALGFLQREFTAYAVLGLCVVGIVDGTLLAADTRRVALRAALAFAAVWIAVSSLKTVASAAGPGTSIADVSAPSSNLGEVAARFCGDLAAAVRSAPALYREYLAYLFGLERQPVSDFAVNSAVVQGAPGLAIVFGVLVLLCIWSLAANVARGGSTPHEQGRGSRLLLYLAAVGAAGILFYDWGRCGELSIQTLRYGLLGVFLMVALAAGALRAAHAPALRGAIVACILVWSAASLFAHARIAVEYGRRPPPNWRGILADYLVERGVRYAESDYWTAYHVTFLSGERVVVGTRDFPRILTYQRVLDAHRDETWTIGRERCATGLQVIPRWWVCPPERKEPGARK